MASRLVTCNVCLLPCVTLLLNCKRNNARPNEKQRKLDTMVEVPMRQMYAEMLAEDVPFPVGVQIAARPYCEELTLRVRTNIAR